MSDTYIMSDQPETCRRCGTRTHFVERRDYQLHRGVVGRPDYQLHRCPSCGYRYKLVDREITEKQ